MYIPYEIEIGAFRHQFVSRFGLVISFFLFFPDIQQPDPGIAVFQYFPAVYRADDAVLIQYFRLAINIDAYVQKQCFSAFYGRNRRSNSGADDPIDLFDDMHAAYHHGAGAARAGEAVDFACFQMSKTHNNARIAFG